MRIVGGTLGGRVLRAPRNASTRPTSEKVREALFNLLGPPPDALHVLDLFAGSGAMGLEALSRGALRCVFVERDREACRVIQGNLEKLRFTGALVLSRDTASALRDERARGHRYDLVLVDPPYEEWEHFSAALAELLPAVLEENGVAVIETSARVEPELPLDLVTSRRYGSARITVFSR